MHTHTHTHTHTHKVQTYTHTHTHTHTHTYIHVHAHSRIDYTDSNEKKPAMFVQLALATGGIKHAYCYVASY